MALPIFLDGDNNELSPAAAQVAQHYPRVRFMGSKYRLLADLEGVFEQLQAGPALDAFSGSGVVSYLLKASGRPVVSNDLLVFSAMFARAMVENSETVLAADSLAQIDAGPLDGKTFIRDTFSGRYFSDEDHVFLDTAWSHLRTWNEYERSIAISALCLAAARKQPRGVFTVVDRQYDDGRRHLRMTMAELFREAVEQVNAAVDQVARVSAPCRAQSGDVLTTELPTDCAVAYFDPPYAPRRDDTDYIKRYHFLEGLATYWEGQTILWNTKTLKLAKVFTPFAYPRTALQALDRLFERVPGADLVLSYGSNAAFSPDELASLLKRHRRGVDRIDIDHRYAFGTHSSASRRVATEFIFIAQGAR